MGEPEQNERTVRGYYEAFNQRDFEAIGEAMTDDIEFVTVGTGERLHGREAAVRTDRNWLQAFPDGKVGIDNIIVAGDMVVVEYTGSGTHTGILRSGDGDIPPTGRSASIQFCDVIELRDGKVSVVRAYYDTAALMTQLGLLPEPASAG